MNSQQTASTLIRLPMGTAALRGVTTSALLALIMAVLLACPSLFLGSAAWADEPPQRFLCDGDPLLAVPHRGPVDATGIPNSNAGTVPGGYIELQWRGISLQLPRTNNAGIPSYTDGRWWWQAIDPDHPEFAQRRGNAQTYTCEPQT